MKKRIVIAIVIIAVVLGLGYFFGKDIITLESIKEQREYLMDIVAHHYIPSVIIFILAYILIVISSLPLAAVMTILSGFLYGVTAGTIYTNIGATIGATISFLIFRYVVGQSVQERYKVKLAAFNENIKRYGARYMIIIHLFMIVPFFIINALAAFTQMSLWTFMWTTALGIIPSSILYTYAGNELGTITSARDIISWPIIVIFGALIALALGSVGLDHYRQRRKQIK